MSTPDTKPFSRENVITLPITGAKDGSKNPLKPSSSPSVPPSASPNIGLERLIPFSCTSANRSLTNSLRIRIGLHHAEEISFRVREVREIAHRRNRRLRHHQLSARLGHRVHGAVHRFHTNRV